MVVKNWAAVAAACTLVATGLGTANLITDATAQRSDPDRERIEKIVREYLLSNPEIILEVVDILNERERAEATAMAAEEVRANLPTLLSGANGHALGAATGDADVLLVEFYDYNCGFCKQAMDFVLGLTAEDPALRVVLKELPVVHPASEEVALASLAVAGTDEFLPFHRALMNHSGLVTMEALPGIASTAGVSFDHVASALGDDQQRASLENRLSQSFAIGEAIGVTGTPAFIVASPDGKNVKVVSGFDVPAIKDAITAIRTDG